MHVTTKRLWVCVNETFTCRPGYQITSSVSIFMTLNLTASIVKLYFFYIKFIFLQEARPFSCHICEYSCKLKGNLNSHMKNIHKLEIISTHKLREKMIKTGKGYNEYMSARRSFIDSEKSSSDLSVQTRPISEKTITTEKSYHEYGGERMHFMESERISSNLTLQNRPMSESYNEHIPVHVSEERHVQMGDNLEKYQELLNFVGNCNIPLSYS